MGHHLWGIRHGTGNKAMGRDETPGKGVGGHQRTGPKKRAPKNIKGLPMGKAPKKRKKKGRVV